MGYGGYDMDSRNLRSASQGYYSKSRDEIFVQNRKREIHESMDTRKISIREACDSEAHPNTVPIQLYLDVTGSMGHIPHEMIKDGLPTLMSNLIQNGVEDATLLFGAVGDHECDRYPLQVGQLTIDVDDLLSKLNPVFTNVYLSWGPSLEDVKQFR